MEDPRQQLLTVFRRQQAFSRDYSPLYASLFGAIAAWLEDEPRSPVSAWLLDAANGRQGLDVSLLVAAGLHRDVLLAEPALAELAAYYPSVGGAQTAGRLKEGAWQIDPNFQEVLQQAIIVRQDELRAFMRRNMVQTNETGRGIAWLLPATLAGWPRFHLLDLGASAGLNLVADKRHFAFVDEEDGGISGWLGAGQPPQFEIHAPSGTAPIIPIDSRVPQILSRNGCDIHPFELRDTHDEATLAAFVWADQPARLDRLREGIAALRSVAKSDAPVQLHATVLPDDLSQFLERHMCSDSQPVLCYSTYIRMYLADRGNALGQQLAAWASEVRRPLLWIQWEPPSRLDRPPGQAPEFGWLAWTADLWLRGQEYHWLLGWVHPHGQHVRWLPGLAEFGRAMRAMAP